MELGTCRYSITLWADVARQAGVTAGVLRRAGTTPGKVECLKGSPRLISDGISCRKEEGAGPTGKPHPGPGVALHPSRHFLL